MKSNDLISIIIPVYNCEKYIESTVNSIKKQTYQNFEIIIVNDGSLDKTKDICSQLASSDKRIKLFNNSNHGCSYSKNFGLNNSTGRYVCFVDGDDILSKYFLEILYKEIKDSSQLSSCGIIGFKNEDDISHSYSGFDKFDDFNQFDFKRELFGYYGGFLANKMYDLDIIRKNNLTLDDDLHISEDLFFNLKYIKYCDKVTCSSENLYFYRIHSASSYYNLKNEKWFSVFDTYERIIKNSDMFSGVEQQVIFNLYMTLIEGSYRQKKYFKDRNDIANRISDMKREYKKYYKYLSIKNKIKICIFDSFTNLVMIYKRRKVGN